MRIDVSRICREALRRQPTDSELGAALLRAASRTYRRRSAQVGLAVLEMIEHYANRFGKTRMEVLAEFARGGVSIEQAGTRFGAQSGPSREESLAALTGSRASRGFNELALSD